MAEERDRGLHRHGEPDVTKWDEAASVTGRDNDTPLRGDDTWAVPNSTFAQRAKRPAAKAVHEAEDKSVKRAAKKTTRK